LDQFGSNLTGCYFATHHDGDPPNIDDFYDAKPWELAREFHYWLRPEARPWILNIDLDYFFCDDSSDDEEKYLQMHSDEYITALGAIARERIDDRTVAVTTICLSPELCGGWASAERALTILLRSLNVQFRLPEQP
jgi:hypothetical protein